MSLLLVLGFAALWVRSERTMDDWFVIYRAGGSEQLRSWRGYLILHHKAPDGEVPRQGVERLSHYAVRTDSVPPDVGLSPGSRVAYPTHRRWGPLAYDAGAGVPLQAAKAAFQASLQRPDPRIALMQKELRRLEQAAPPAVGPDGPPDARQRWIANRQARSALQSEISYATVNALNRVFIPPDGSRWQLTFPTWLPLAACTLLSAPWLLHRLRARRRRRAGLCARCGYDLRASKERCPECGEPVPPAERT